MISAAAFCPHPPLLVPEVASGAASELSELRVACVAAVREIAAPDSQLVLLGAGDASRMHSPPARGTLAPWGVPIELHLGSPECGGAPELPLSLTVGAWLVQQALGPSSGAIGFSVGPDFGSSRAAADLLAVTQSRAVALLVLGDGTARRSTSAPGYLDHRAAAFDDDVLAALESGSPEGLLALDATLGADLLAAGVPAWQAAANLLAGADYDPHIDYAGDPYGVAYVVARWTADG